MLDHSIAYLPSDTYHELLRAPGVLGCCVKCESVALWGDCPDEPAEGGLDYYV